MEITTRTVFQLYGFTQQAIADCNIADAKEANDVRMQ
jgi:hypothetical protein